MPAGEADLSALTNWIRSGNLGWLPPSRAVFDHSRIVAVYTTKDERIEIRRVVKNGRDR